MRCGYAYMHDVLTPPNAELATRGTPQNLRVSPEYKSRLELRSPENMVRNIAGRWTVLIRSCGSCKLLVFYSNNHTARAITMVFRFGGCKP